MNDYDKQWIRPERLTISGEEQRRLIRRAMYNNNAK